MKRKIKFMMIAIIIISIIYFIKTTNSRYISQINLSNNVNVAIPQIILDDSTIDTSRLLVPGDTLDCEFYVKNYDESNINEVLMTYYINLNITESAIPLTYKIYEVSGTNKIELTQSDNGFGPITLNYGAEEEKHYKIIFTWDENDNNAQYADKQFSFVLEINATQVI